MLHDSLTLMRQRLEEALRVEDNEADREEKLHHCSVKVSITPRCLDVLIYTTLSEAAGACEVTRLASESRVKLSSLRRSEKRMLHKRPEGTDGY